MSVQKSISTRGPIRKGPVPRILAAQSPELEGAGGQAAGGAGEATGEEDVAAAGRSERHIRWWDR